MKIVGRSLLGLAFLVPAILLWRSSRSDRFDPIVIEVDCGPVQAKAVIEKVVKIQNPTRKQLKVNRLVSSCGCVSKSISDEIIKPGQEVELSISYKASDLPGTFHQHIEVSFEDSNTGVSVNLTGTVVSWYGKVEGTLNFGEIIAGTSARRMLEVELQSDLLDAEFEVIQPVAGLDVTLDRVAKEGRNGVLTLTSVFHSSADEEFGRRSGELILQCRGTDNQLRLPWSVFVVSSSDLNPRIANFGVVSSKSAKRSKVVWKKRGPYRNVVAKDLSASHSFGDAVVMEFMDNGENEIIIEISLLRSVSETYGVFEGFASVVNQDGTVRFQIPIMAFITPPSDQP